MRIVTHLLCSVLLLLVISRASLHALESIPIGDSRNIFITALDREKGLEAIFYGDSLKVVDLNLFKIILAKRLVAPLKAKLSNVHALYINQNLYLFTNNGGEVFQVINDSVKRIDNSNSHKMQQGSYLFEFKGQAFRYGGYGFWSFRNYFTYYHFGTKEWEVISPEGSKTFPQGSGNGTLVQVIGDNCYVFGGEEVNLQIPIVYQPHKEFWVFHIQKKEWELLGELNPALINSVQIPILGDKNQILFVDRKNTNVLDFEKNQLTTFRNNAITINLIKKDQDHKIRNYGYKGNYYLLFNLNSQDSIQLLYKTSNIYAEQPIEKDEIYKSHNQEMNLISGLIAVLVGLILILTYAITFKKKRKKNQIQILDGKLVYERRILGLDPQQLELMELFMLSKELSSSEILALIDNEYLHHTQNVRHMHALIDELNMKLRLLTDETTDLIREEKSEIDRRIKIYKINRIYVG